MECGLTPKCRFESYLVLHHKGDAMFQKGPGEGYMAAKEQALAHNSDLVCLRVRKGTNENFHVFDGDEIVGRGRSSRDAWSDYLFQNKLLDYQ